MSVCRVRGGLLLWASVFLCLSSTSLLAAPCGGVGNLSGVVFNDFNGDTVQGGVNIETGVADITVTVYSDDGSINSCETLSDGTFALDAPAGGFPVRLEVSIGADKDYLFSGASGPSRVQFFSAPTAGIAAGLLNPKEYCDSNPMVATSCFVNGNPELDEGDPGTASVADVIVGFPYNASGNTAAINNNYLALGGEVGATWGLAFQRQSDLLMAASVMKRHVGFAHLGPGGIYQVDMTDPMNPVASDFVDLAAAPYNIDFGVDNHILPSSDPMLATYDQDAWDFVGKMSYGGLAFSEDETTLWTVNMHDRRLYEIPVGIPAAPPVAADINSYDIPNPGCMDSSVMPAVPAPDDHRPWAVEYYQGMVYVGLVCSAQTSQQIADMSATVYRFDPDNPGAGFLTVITFPLNYPRGLISAGGGGTGAEWLPWIADFSDIPNPNQSYGQAIYPQPAFTDLQFDVDGSIVVALVDRLGHQMGNNNYGNPPSTELHEAAVGGDVLRVCFDGSSYSLEDNASCDGGLTATGGANGANGGQGPGGGEWYWQDMYPNSGAQDSGTHNEITLGGVAHLPGSGQIVLSVFDPTNRVRSGGARWFTNADGTSNRGYMVFDTDAGGGATTFGKSAGLGDVELMCPQAPLEIGNRIWCDTDHDGIQDASEGVAPGVTVTLQCGADLPVDTITDANGNYYFDDVSYNTVNGDLVPRNAACTVTVNTAIPANNTALNNACQGTVASVADNGGPDPDSDLRDSDGVDNGAGLVSVGITTGYAGHNNHAIDFGFGAPTDLGDLPDPTYPTLLASNGAVHDLPIGAPYLGQCVDSEVDGQPSVGADGDDLSVGSTTFGTCAVAGDDEDGISDVQNLYVGSGIASLDVEVNGSCLLDAWMDFNQDGDLNDAGEQIFTSTAVVNGLNDNLSFTVPAGAVAGDTFARFRCSGAGGLSPTGPALDGEVEDYVFTVAPLLSLGDFVWYDTNQDGIQDAGETGVNGVQADLYPTADCSGPSTANTTTANGGLPAADGFYEFTDLPPGTYCVAFSNIPGGYTISPANQGGDAVDSDADPLTGRIENINLTADDPTNDMGIFLNGSIAGLTWCESATNANTTYNPGDLDALLSNIQITLYSDANCNDVVDGGDAGTAVTQDTNGTGDYLFTGLPVGPAGNAICYITEVDSNDTDLGTCNNLITTPTLGPDLDVNAPDSTGNNFGFDENINLGDFVWYDTNQDGIQDVGEPGVNGVTVELFSNATCTGVADDTTVTANGGLPAADGFYEFTGLSSGTYCVAFGNIPGGYTISPADQGGDAVDSDADPLTGRIENINLTADDPTNDMGIFLNGSIAGLTWCESATNANTTYNPGDLDALLSNIQITLYSDANCNDVVDGGDAGTAVTQDTNGTGDYLFTGLPVGPAGNAICYITEVDSNDTDLGTCNNLITTPTLGPDLDVNAPDSTGNNFGFDENINLGDFVWYDTNQDGIQDTGEPGVNGVTVELFSNATCTGVADDTTVTANGGLPAADGFYEFTSLSSGTYCVAFSNLPPGHEISPQNVGGNDGIDSDVDPLTGRIENINLTADDPTNDMGISLDGSIAGLTWCESSTNANTTYNAGDGDTLIPGIQITLYEDANCSDTVDGGDAATAITQDTDGSGSYLFTDLPVGPVGSAICYITEVDTSDTDLNNCDTPITPPQLTPDLDVSDPDSVDNNFGFDDSLELGDYVWYDNNQNGSQDANERGVNGITVNLYDNATCTGVPLDTTTTSNGGTPANDGYYLFPDLDAGSYCVEFTGLPADYVFTVDNQGTDDTDSDADPSSGRVENIQLNASDYTIDAGIYAANGAVSGLLFCDTNPENGSPDVGEGIEGVTATLYRDFGCDDTQDQLVGSVMTDADGMFSFTDLPVAMAPVPPNPSVCYVLGYDQAAPELADCQIPITPETQTVELTEDEPVADLEIFGVVPRGEPRPVPLSNWSSLLMMLLLAGLTMTYFRRQAKN